ncbi:hypothetical protein 278BB001_195 [Bacillus phage 278BB001]|nr:hypothetical protein 278BB001_195 [Bacillus phage 278BB001]
MLVNKSLAGKVVATEFGNITFNENGESKDLKPEQEKVLAQFEGFEVAEKKAPKAKEEAPAEEKAEEKKPAPKKKKAKE